MKLIYNILPYLLLTLTPYTIWAQKEKFVLREGNNQYNNGRYKQAEAYYGEALKEKNNYFKANYNLGNAMYKQGKFQDATGQYDVFIKNTGNKDTLRQAFHNLGNSYLKQKKYEDAIKAYKSSLKLDPKDEDTRYNLAYAKKKLQEQQKKDQQNKDKQNQDKKDQKKDQQKQDKDKDKKDQEKKDESQMSKEEAQRMLDALKNAEQKLQEFHKKKGDKNAETKKIEKDW